LAAVRAPLEGFAAEVCTSLTGVIRSRRCSGPAWRSGCPHPPSARAADARSYAPGGSVSVTHSVEWTTLTASGSLKGDPPSRRACRSARRMISSSSRPRRRRRVTEHRLRRCRREPHPNSCIGGGPVGSHGGAGWGQTAMGPRSCRQRPRRAWRCRWRSGLLVPAARWLTRKPQTLARGHLAR
jgi:hypothetical protein